MSDSDIDTILSRRGALLGAAAIAAGSMAAVSSSNALATPAPPSLPPATSEVSPFIARIPQVQLDDLASSCSNPLARPRTSFRLVPRRSSRAFAFACDVLGEAVRLAERRAAVEQFPSIPDQHRRARHPLPSCEVKARKRASDYSHPRLARIDLRVS